MYREPLLQTFILAGIVSLAAVAAGHTAELTPRTIDQASFSEWSEAGTSASPDPFLVRVEVLLDRAHISPGVIDGYLGENLIKAVRTFKSG